MKSIGSYFPTKSKDMNIKLSAIVNRQIKPNNIIVIDDSSADEEDVAGECRMDDTPVQDLKSNSQGILNLSSGTKVDPVSENPFIQFAHGLGASESSYFSKSATLPICINSANSRQIVETNKSQNKTHSTIRKDIKRKRKRKESTDVENFASKSEEELIECMQKWQSMAVEDAPLEVRRFQVLVAARLHAQSQEPVVRKAMKALHEYFYHTSDESKFLCCESLSKADPEIISNIISSVLFANVKSKHIVQAAREVKTTFHGIVPTSQHGLKSITGIGPHLAELLFYVNSPKAFAKIESLKVS